MKCKKNKAGLKMGLRADVANVLVSIFGVCVFNMHMA